MDTLAHVVAGMLLCSKTGLPGGRVGAVDREGRRKRWDMTLWAAGGFAFLPDMSSFGLLLAQRVITGTFTAGKPELDEIPAYVFFNYNLTHSLVVAAVVVLLVWRFARPLRLPVLAWPLHILCDIPMHGKEYFPTPFLYPLSDYTFDGWGFGAHPGIIYGYWLVILLLFAAVVLMRRRPGDSGGVVAGKLGAEEQ